MKKLNQNGFAHWVAPALVIALIAIAGVIVLKGSHADTPTVDSTAATAAAGPNHYFMLNFGKGGGNVTTVTDNIPDIGGQTAYQIGADGSVESSFIPTLNIKEACFYVHVYANNKGVPAKGKVIFKAGSTTVTRTLSYMSDDSLNKECVNYATGDQDRNFSVTNPAGNT